MNLSQELKVLSSYPCLYLQPFNSRQVDLYLELRVPFIKPRDGEIMKTWRYYREQIKHIHDLSDLMKRPVLLEMIIKTLPVLVEEGKPVNRPNLYQHYLEGELERQLRKQRRDLLIDRQKRFEIMERIALELYKTDRPTLSSNQILEVSKELLTSEQRSEMEGSLREILTCSFLLREGDEYGFSHQSFQEYLIACRLAKDIAADKRENFVLKRISKTIQGFLLELAIDTLQDNSVTDESIIRNIVFDSRRLMSWFQANPNSVPLSSNSFSLIVRLFPNDEICKLLLKGADLTGADLTGAMLIQASLFEANLNRTKLNGADLSGVNFSGANLSEAEFSRANLTGSRLSNTIMIKARITNAKLNRSVLRFAKLADVDFTGADLTDVDFTGADLTNANLTGAKLTRADFRGTKVAGVNLTNVDITGIDLTKPKMPIAMLIDMKKGITLWG